jgi:hypothetical protein
MPGAEQQHSKPVRLATAALYATVDRQWATARHALERLNAECGPDGLGLALIAWCDTFAEHANGGPPEFQRVRMVVWNMDTGAVGEPACSPMRWATDLIRARAQGDRAAFVAGLAELDRIEDGFERGRYVFELVQSVALTIRSFPRGYGRMGRPEVGDG